jgi:NAD(P)-dependent dehydrogenase (short-subunit alcohol dehydrogenase family)
VRSRTWASRPVRQADVTVAEDCRRSVETTTEVFGRLDVLFNNAGVYLAGDVTECTEDEWNLQVDVSLKGTYLMCASVVPVMIAQGGGSIVNNSSGWGLVGGERAVAYCAAKGGVVLMTKAMALDHGRDGIRVNCICPGDTVTPMEHRDAEHQGVAWEDYVAGASDRPLGRMGQPDEVARRPVPGERRVLVRHRRRARGRRWRRRRLGLTPGSRARPPPRPRPRCSTGPS